MTFKEKKEIYEKGNKLCEKAFELIEKNQLARELCELCRVSDNWTLGAEELENCNTKEVEKREELEQANIINKKEFYETFIRIVKKYGK